MVRLQHGLTWLKLSKAIEPVFTSPDDSDEVRKFNKTFEIKINGTPFS